MGTVKQLPSSSLSPYRLPTIGQGTKVGRGARVSTPQVLKVSALLLALGGCSASLAECFRDTGALSTREEGVALPRGCRVTDRTGTDLRRLECDDGRQGFVFGS